MSMFNPLQIAVHTHQLECVQMGIQRQNLVHRTLMVTASAEMDCLQRERCHQEGAEVCFTIDCFEKNAYCSVLFKNLKYVLVRLLQVHREIVEHNYIISFYDHLCSLITFLHSVKFFKLLQFCISLFNIMTFHLL